MTTLKITVGQDDRLRGEGLERVARAENGEDVEGVGDRHVLDFEDHAALTQFLGKLDLDLIRVISEHEPTSIRQTAELVGRDVKNVHGNLATLEALNVIEFVQEGRSKRPVVPYDDIEMSVSVQTRDEIGESAPA
jgi:predicted transcriptional regulator